MTPRAYLALGSNLGERERLLGEARLALAARDGIRLAACSAVVETAPVEVLDQPDFLNQVVGVDTTLAPAALLESCLAIERDLGRDRSAGPRRGPRRIDLDVLLYDGEAVEEPGLVVPHPRLARRAFLLDLLRQIGAPPAWIPEPREAG